MINKHFRNNREPYGKHKLTRHEPTIQERQRVLIICEGRKTEPLYLKAFIDSVELTTGRIKIYGNQSDNSAPINIVNFGIDKLSEDPNFDKIYFVFDRDTHATYDSALVQIEKLKKTWEDKTIMAITSFPCFEIWFLLHFKTHGKQYGFNGNTSPCTHLISELKKIPVFSKYKKGHRNYFNILKDRMDIARNNSKITLEQSKQYCQSPHHADPSTLMHELISGIEEVIVKYNK